MKSLLLHLRKLDWVLIISAMLLVGIGLLSLYSSSMGRGDFFNFKKQLIFAGIGLFLMFSFYFFDYRIFRNDPYLILILYFLCLISLAGLFFFAPEIRGAQRWYKVGAVSLDPVELAKLVLIILLAKYFSMRHVELYRISHIFYSGFYVLLPSILIFFQPDFGSVIILIALWVAVLVVSGIKIRPFLVLSLCAILVLILSWPFLLKDYQKERVLSFLSPQADPLGAGWSQTQSKIAIGSGGVLGQGIGKGPQTQYGFLPEPQTDFIFAAIGEEFGLVGIGVLFFLFSVLVWRIIKIALISQSNFPRLFALGFAVIFISQIFINVGMNLGLLPIIGISLPLVSYGGSGLITTLIGLGIIQSIRLRIHL